MPQKAALPHCFANKCLHRETFKIDNDENTGDEKCQLESNGSCCQPSFAAGAVSPPPGLRPRPPFAPLPGHHTTEYHQEETIIHRYTKHSMLIMEFHRTFTGESMAMCFHPD